MASVFWNAHDIMCTDCLQISKEWSTEGGLNEEPIAEVVSKNTRLHEKVRQLSKQLPVKTVQ